MKRLIIAAALAATPFAAVTAQDAMPEMGTGDAIPGISDAAQARLAAVLADDARAEDAQRDRYRHPAETIAFMRVEPGMKVADYAPGGGWYTRVLAPYLADGGQYVGLFFAPDTLPFDDDAKARMRAQPAAYPAEEARPNIPESQLTAYSTDRIPEADLGTFDRVIVMRMMHNLMRWNVADNELKAIRSMLKPGGMLGIVQHRAKADATANYADGNHGYLRQQDVVDYVEALGFDLVGTSEVNANPRDDADYPDGVWTLPPSYALKDRDKAKYTAIGESDRMTLLFRKRG
ncbi:class I SAM-dependent methyltransferase [Novosphingopyxis sp.]|uniref:class I SAM-dependent methyltransferase n=1 Tax=Novosphingopyxis sp. TaxID=2709690 RepID=UPI003B5C1450